LSFRTVQHHIHEQLHYRHHGARATQTVLNAPTAQYLSSFWKDWSPSSKSRNRYRGGSGGTSESTSVILSAEISRITPVLLLLFFCTVSGAERLVERSNRTYVLALANGEEVYKSAGHPGFHRNPTGWHSACGWIDGSNVTCRHGNSGSELAGS
ncbi:hypothetical protein AAFF_G00255410, partial [Aldrovandia affinis]